MGAVIAKKVEEDKEYTAQQNHLAWWLDRQMDELKVGLRFECPVHLTIAKCRAGAESNRRPTKAKGSPWPKRAHFFGAHPVAEIRSASGSRLLCGRSRRFGFATA
jgi:hypothetical protein